MCKNYFTHEIGKRKYQKTHSHKEKGFVETFDIDGCLAQTGEENDWELSENNNNSTFISIEDVPDTTNSIEALDEKIDRELLGMSANDEEPDTIHLPEEQGRILGKVVEKRKINIFIDLGMDKKPLTGEMQGIANVVVSKTDYRDKVQTFGRKIDAKYGKSKCSILAV